MRKSGIIPEDIQHAIDAAYEDLAPRLGEGEVAKYIPELADVDPCKLGIAVATVGGHFLSAGDAREPFSIQSISKVFTLTLALGKVGDILWRRVGREPSGSAFNSIVQLEHERGIPRNPFINAGAIVVSDCVLGNRSPAETIEEILQFVQCVAHDGSIAIDKAVARSEEKTGYRNRALANYMRSFGNLENSVERVLEVYFNHSAIAMSCCQLARAGLFLAAGGRDPITDYRLVSRERVRRVNALMLTCGHYDGSGDFAFSVGLPGKSGVGGGILAIAPGVASIAAWSPALNRKGNSLFGALALEKIAARLGWAIF
jgi:glutaminase